MTDALVEDKMRELVWQINEVTGRRQMTPEGPYCRRKMLAPILRQDGLADAVRGVRDRTMRTLGLQGVVCAR